MQSPGVCIDHAVAVHVSVLRPLIDVIIEISPSIGNRKWGEMAQKGARGLRNCLGAVKSLETGQSTIVISLTDQRCRR